MGDIVLAGSTSGTTTLTPTAIFDTTDGDSILFAPNNTNYQTYLKWVSEGNTLEQAD